MRWLSHLRERISAVWLMFRLSVLLSQFLIWFGTNQYLLGRVFLVSLCWLALTLLLVANQVLAARIPNVITPELQTLDMSPTQQAKLTWKLVSKPELEKFCVELDTASQTHSTHQSLLRNKALCWLSQNRISAAQEAWNQAQARNPNQ